MHDKFTPWFRVTYENPIRPGLYQVALDGNPKRHMFARWDGECWHAGRPFGAAMVRYPSSTFGDRWRGLVGPASDDLPDAQEGPPIAF